MGTCGGAGPAGVLVVLRRGGARGVGVGVSGREWIRGHRLCLRVALWSVRTGVAGHLLEWGRHRGLVLGWGRCLLALALLRSGRGWSVGLVCGFWVPVG